MGGDSISCFTAKCEPGKMLYTREHLARRRGPRQRRTGVRVLHTLRARSCGHLAAPSGAPQHRCPAATVLSLVLWMLFQR